MMLGRLAKWYRGHLRGVDLNQLWPVCKQMSAGDMDIAKAAFATHAFNDPAWTKDYSHEELVEFIDALE